MHHRTRSQLAGLAALAALGGILGCSPSRDIVRNEPSSVAKQLGLPKCRVSVPMTEEQVLQSVRLDGVPDGQAREFLASITMSILPGDDIRLVTCVRRTGSGRSVVDYYYAKFRKGEEIDKHYDVILD